MHYYLFLVLLPMHGVKDPAVAISLYKLIFLPPHYSFACFFPQMEPNWDNHLTMGGVMDVSIVLFQWWLKLDQ